ncbi:hypothetical protein GIY23_02700 [Allosaccharopolyspora coralli]|uniref:Uncharacterized protein n=1 Tax=Allosaccharopolyspora coralli TaxID=2665642 RepID=A0A5Q3Q236_9PSEU|nr:hypothetical protein [Allosaccharopolyspora coralli]QGK68611.1 hypothetical protein GIY23_02700 [Allosaccharopolyspora coralli]
MTEPPLSAADRYREVAALATQGAQQLRDHERAKAQRLRDELPDGRARLTEAEAEHAEVVDGVRKRWDHAMDALFDEKWMQVSRMPDADSDAEPCAPSEAIRRVQVAYLELRDTLGQPGWRATSWLPRRPWRSRRRGPED